MSCAEPRPLGQTQQRCSHSDSAASCVLRRSLLSRGPVNVVHSGGDGGTAHERMIRQSFQTQVIGHRPGSLLNKMGKAVTSGTPVGSPYGGHKHSHSALCTGLFIWGCRLIMDWSLTGALSAILTKSGQEGPLVPGSMVPTHQHVV